MLITKVFLVLSLLCSAASCCSVNQSGVTWTNEDTSLAWGPAGLSIAYVSFDESTMTANLTLDNGDSALGTVLCDASCKTLIPSAWSVHNTTAFTLTPTNCSRIGDCSGSSCGGDCSQWDGPLVFSNVSWSSSCSEWAADISMGIVFAWRTNFRAASSGDSHTLVIVLSVLVGAAVLVAAGLAVIVFRRRQSKGYKNIN